MRSSILAKLATKTGKSLLLVLFFFLFFSVVHTPKAAAADCNPDLVASTSAYYNVAIQVAVLNPDGSFRKWSKDFTINVETLNPLPYGPSTINPNTAINWPGHGGFPTSNANFRATEGGGGTLQCPAYIGGNSTKLVFGDGVDGHPFLACLWGNWGLGDARRHGVGFRFTPVGINDAGGSGYWVANQPFGLISNGRGGGTIDVNNINDDFTFSYRLTSIQNPPEGNLERADCEQISGWARDLDAPNGVTEVHLYFDDPGNPGLGVNLGKTNIYRPDPSLQGDYGFSIDGSDPRIPVNLYSGTHTVYAYAIDVGGSDNRQLSSSPKTIGVATCAPKASTTSGTASTNIDNTENPNTVTFGASITQTSPNYGVTVTRKFYVIRAGGNPNNPADRVYFMPDVTYTQTGTKVFDDIPVTNVQGGPANLKVGDLICSAVTVDSPGVTIGFRGAILNPQPAQEFTPSCKRFVNLPYLSVYGGDVSAGGDFAGGACAGTAGINTNNNSSGLGAGVEFAAQATGAINGFATARGRGAPGSLAFANVGGLGNFGSSHCIKDYFADSALVTSPVDTTSTRVNFNQSKDIVYKPASGRILMGGALTNSNRSNIYVEGDVIIDSSIDYASPTWGDTDAIPSIHLYVKGNIYIQNTVAKMVGMYVAQPLTPTDTTKGKIVTCTDGAGGYIARVNLFAACGVTKLTVNGALIANKIEFLRTTANSLRNASAGTEGNPATSNAAEIIEVGPELKMVTPDHVQKKIVKKYQYFTTLPPVL